MRRLLVVCLLLMLPLQGAWAAIAGIAAAATPCAASQPAVVHGGHAGDGDASAVTHDDLAGCDGGLPAQPCCDGACSGSGGGPGCGGCSVCHAQALVALVSVPAVPGRLRSADGVPLCRERGAPDHVPEQPLKPPLPQRA